MPSALNQSFGWQVGTNAPVSGAFLALTSEEAGELEISLNIDDPQKILMFVGFPTLTGVEGYDVMAPTAPYAEATVYPAKYACFLEWNCELLEIYPSYNGGADGGRYEATAYLFSSSASAECNVWPTSDFMVFKEPEYPCAECSEITFTLKKKNGAGNGWGGFQWDPYPAHHWTGDDVPEDATNTAYCNVGPIGPDNSNIDAHLIFLHRSAITGEIEEMESIYGLNYYTYADQVQSLSCGGVTVTNENKTLYILYEQQPGIAATKFCANCPWNTWFSGPVGDQNSSGNSLSGTLNLPAPGSYQVSISKGGKTLTLDIKGIKADMEIYKPKVIDPAEAMIPDASEMTTGSVTFVNLDNDDDDSKFDYNGAGTHDDVVTGGDNELVKVKLKIQPNNLTNGTVKLTATEGGSSIAVWTNADKSASSAYTLGATLNITNGFTIEGDSIVKTLWVEGISAHTAQRATKLKMEYTGNGVTCQDEAALTVVGLDQVVWQGKTNSISDTSTLDADPNWPGGLTPSAVRVFPDARVVGGSVEANPRDKVGVEVTLSVAPPSEIKVYLESFDVDDPTASTNVVDNESTDDDNRGTSPANAGQFVGESSGVKEIIFMANNKVTNCDFQVTMQPGDNFRVVANGDKDFLAKLENKDSTQDTGANDTEKNANKQRIVNKDVTGTPAEREVRLAGDYVSDTLTVWRFLHVEVDSMTAPPTTGAEKNTVDGNVTAVAGNGTVAQNVTLSINLNTGLTPNDNSANLTAGTGNGRFENGWIKIGSGAGTPGQTTTTNLLGNGDDYVRKDAGIDIPAKVSKAGESNDVNGKVIAWSGTTFSLNISSGTLSTNYNDGTLNVAGVSMTVSSVDTNNNTVTVTATQNIPFVLHDDDDDNVLPQSPDVSGMALKWQHTYILPLFDTGYDTINDAFHLNSSDITTPGHWSEGRLSTTSTPACWIVMVKNGFQTSIYETDGGDNDADNEGTWRAAAIPQYEAVMLLEESIRDWIAAPTNSVYGGGGGVDPDTTGAPNRQTRRQEILNHEVGHLFGLSGSHWEGEPAAAGSPYGDVMRPSTMRQSSDFGHTSLHKIRLKIKPGPGS